jgi:predicted neutral ceramidase superfamily lipid hydrolase
MARCALTAAHGRFIFAASTDGAAVPAARRRRSVPSMDSYVAIFYVLLTASIVFGFSGIMFHSVLCMIIWFVFFVLSCVWLIYKDKGIEPCLSD